MSPKDDIQWTIDLLPETLLYDKCRQRAYEFFNEH